MIPKIIHQTAPKERKKWHPLWEMCHKSWKDNFKSPEFGHILWTDEDLDNLVKDKFPDYFDFYIQLPYHIMQLDFARFCILYEYGGIYADMDFYCYSNFYSELTEDTHIVGSSVERELVQNSLMCSSKNNSFFLQCIKKSKEKFGYTQNIPEDEVPNYIKKSFGPNFLTELVIKNSRYSKIILNPNTYNNHPSYYSEELKTRHMLTGIWGKETIQNSGNQVYDNTFLRDYYLNSKQIPIKEFSEFNFKVNYLN